jgi:hypothetical protein
MSEPATKIPTAADVLKRQREDHAVIAPAGTMPAVTDGGATGSVRAYLMEHASPGTMMKFSKDGKFIKIADDEEIPEGTQFICVYHQAQVGFIRFNGKGEQPDRRMGSLFGGFVPPKREELGDLDESLWDTDLSGRPADPWQQQILLPLQNIESGELFIFGTTSATGRRAVSNLLAQCERMLRREPDKYPVIKLRIGGFQHRDERVGWVKTPAFDVVGKAPKGDTSAATAAISADLNDQIPF